MAETDYNAFSWAQLTTGPGSQGSDLSAPLLSPHAPFQQQYPPLYETPYMPISNPSMPQNQNIPDASYSGQPQGRSPYPPIGSYHFYNPPARAYPYMPAQPRPPPAYWNDPLSLRTDLPGLHDAVNTMQGVQPFFSPSTPRHRHEVPTLSNAGPASFPRRRYDPGMNAISAARNSHREDVRAPPGDIPNPLPAFRAQNAGPSHQQHRQPGYQTLHNTEEGPWMAYGTHGHRSDDSISPRTSIRRNYARYSVDLSHSSTSSDAEEAAARTPPPHRARQRPRSSTQRPHFDPNIATLQQMQYLKDSLPRRLPSELSNEASKSCDICQKDYSTTHVQPTEEEEIAVELSCGHSFGEFCIFQWFDTCKTHKNKVTCPMCRKQLIEPSRYRQVMMHAFSRDGQSYADLLTSELRGEFSHM
ncbi:hypothetical protein EJ02DRAFT_339113 [Clathrospora elynae]|uniref:RING-type domain-containing protein n=1 Tax=Clathrospora elynae TaxID=706981 RepID=A0A6A5SZM7_9PLEO|nr:hypothetical protein EJ02DRAFT_339113 [Clathrospora elynae]